MPVKAGEIFPLFVSLLYLISAELEIRFSRSEKIIKKLRNPGGAKKNVLFLDPLKNLKRTRLISLMEAADRRLGWRPSCLRRTIALAALSRGLGLSPQFKIGVTRGGGSFRAHSWLEIGGLKLEIDGEAENYLELSQGQSS